MSTWGVGKKIVSWKAWYRASLQSKLSYPVMTQMPASATVIAENLIRAETIGVTPIGEIITFSA